MWTSACSCNPWRTSSRAASTPGPASLVVRPRGWNRRAPCARRRARRPAYSVVAARHAAGAWVRAAVLGGRTEDGPGVIHTVCRTLADLGVSVRSAHVTTLGPQAVDVFYVEESGAGALSETRAADAAHAVLAALLDAVTLEQRA